MTAAPLPAPDRAQMCHVALCQIRQRVETDLVLLCTLAHEIHSGSYWSQISRSDGRPYETEEAYFESTLGIGWRSAAKRIAVGRFLAGVEPEERDQVGEALAAVGIARAAILVPALEETDSPDERQAWFRAAREATLDELQEHVSQKVDAKPRGRPAASDRAYRVIYGLMPSLEAQELCREVFRLGKKLCGPEATTTGVLIAMLEETVAAWSPRA